MKKVVFSGNVDEVQDEVECFLRTWQCSVENEAISSVCLIDKRAAKPVAEFKIGFEASEPLSVAHDLTARALGHAKDNFARARATGLARFTVQIPGYHDPLVFDLETPGDELDDVVGEQETIAEGDLISGKLADVLLLQQKNERLRAKAGLAYQKTDATRRDRAMGFFDRLLPVIVPLVERSLPSISGAASPAPFPSHLSDVQVHVPGVLGAAIRRFMGEVSDAQIAKLRSSGIMTGDQIRALEFAYDFMALDTPLASAPETPKPPIVTPPPNGAGEQAMASRPAGQQEVS